MTGTKRTHTPDLRASFYLPASIISRETLDAFISNELAQGDPKAAQLLHHALGNKNRLVPQNEIEAGILQGKADKIHLVAEWIRASVKEDAAWLSHTRADGTPIKLRNDLDKAYADAKKHFFGSKVIPAAILRKRPLDLGDVFPLTDDEVYDLLFFGFEKRGDLRLKTGTKMYHRIHFHITSASSAYMATQWAYLRISREFQFLGWNCTSQDSPRNKRLTKKLFANRLALAHALGVRKLSSSFAAVGAYAFARMGFLPAQPVADSIARITDTARKWSELKWVLDKQSDETFEKIRTLTARKDAKVLWDIADTREIYEGKPLGFHMLHNNYWDGVFFLDNPEQMARARAYIGPAHFDAVMELGERIKQSSHTRMAAKAQAARPPLP